MDAAALPEGAAFCPSCNAAVDDVEEFGGALMCAACGTVLEEAGLVSQRTQARADAADAPAEGFGVTVRHEDTGVVAARIIRGQQGGGGARALVGAGGRPPPDLRSHKAALAAGATAAALPPAVARDAAELLPLVAAAYATNGRYLLPPSLAAVAYLAARNLAHGASMAEVAAGFGVTPLELGRHYLPLVRLLGMRPPPPRLQALIVKHASVLLPRTFPEFAGHPRAHPVTKLARDLGDLMTKVDALHGRSPAVAAAALLALAFSAHGGAKSSAAAADAAGLLGFERHAVQAHVKDYESELLKLAPLLPFFAPPGAPGPPPRPAALLHHVPLLLRLHEVVARAQASGAAAAAAPAAPGGGQGAA
ncbi:MAG: hypothetical protein J3K34DRAFT_520903 [Monoraphidium minutum]|nr:MAG: hypothetical protein J3K34DRAFT_520903 [Monoraphidium minutum]